MGVLELFTAVLIVGVSCINTVLPAAVWSRSRDSRFLFLSAANAGLVLLGLVWTWGQLPVNPPSWAVAQLPVLGLALLVVLLLLATTLWPRRT